MPSSAYPSLPPIAFERPSRFARGISPSQAFGLAVGLIAFWASWAAMLNTAQFGDNVEQYNWAQSLELGYHKHPPMPSWLLGGFVHLFGPSVYWSYVLAAACLIGCAAFTWLLGRRLIGPQAASAAVLLWGLNMSSAQRAQLYNHNTVLMLFVAATAWCAWRASDTRRHFWFWWAATGVLAAGALLSKYQALVPLTGIALALALIGRFADQRHRLGLLVAVATTLLLCLPHALWVARYGFTTLRYASEAVEPSTVAQRLGFLLSFVANQLRIWSPAMLALLLGVTAYRWMPSSEASPPAQPLAQGRDVPWMTGLVWFGLAILAIMALGFGVSLRNHWGAQALQFFGLWLAWAWQRRRPIDLSSLVLAVVAVHALNLAWYAFEHRTAAAVLSERRNDTAYPARRLALAASEHWRSHTACPLQFVAGNPFDAGLVSLYSGGRLQVFDSAVATPWIDRVQLRKSGSVVVLDTGDDAPEDVVDLVDFDMAPADHAGRPAKTLRIGLRYPVVPCP